MFIAVIIVYLIGTALLGMGLGKRVKSATDFLIAGRNLGLVLTTATLAAIQLGAGVILGGSEMGAESGIWPGTWYGIGCGGGLIVAGLLVAAKLRRQGGIVPLDFFGQRYGERRWIRVWGWLSNIPSLLGIFVAQIMAAGSIFQIFGFSYTHGILICGIIIMFYSVAGGMWGVAVTNFVQLIIIVIGIPITAIAALVRLQAMGTVTVAQIVSTPFIPPGMLSKAVFIILPFFIAITVSYDAFMRYQSAKTAKVAQWGCILGGVIVIFISFCTGFIGAAGREIFPSLDNAAVMPRMIEAMLHPLLAGLVVSALLAAAMSTGNCLLVSLAGTFTRDLYNMVINPKAQLDELKHAKTLSRCVIILSLVVGLIIAFRAQGILYTIIIFNYPYMGSMLIPLLGGVLWKRATPRGAISAVIAGGIIGVTAFLAGIPGPLNGLFNVDLGLFVAYAVSAFVFVAVSLATPANSATRLSNSVD